MLPDSVGFYGYSLGNVPAIYLAADRFAPLFLVAEAPFASAASLTQGSLALALPGGWLTGGRFDNAERARSTTTFLRPWGWRSTGRRSTTGLDSA